MDRIITIASDPGSLVLDPFGGSGTTFVAAELTDRRWIGSEMDCSAIIERFDALDGDREHLAEIHMNKNTLFTKMDLARRRKRGLTPLSKDYRLKAEDCVCQSDNEGKQLPLFVATR